MEFPKDQPVPDLEHLEDIRSLDTARMTLRWALERIRSLERLNAELGSGTDAELKLRKKLEEDVRSLQQALAFKSAEADQRELYFSKMEELVSLRLEGKLDVEKLLQREVESQRLQELLRHRQTRLEAEASERRETLEREFRHKSLEVEQQCRSSIQQSEASIEARKAAQDRETASKLTELGERDVRLRLAEEALSQRQKRFQDFYTLQHAQLERDMKRFREELGDQVGFQVQNAERLLEQKHEAAEKAWAREKALLLQELQEWRHKAQEHLPRLLELEKQAAAAEESSRRAQNLAQEQTLRRRELEKAWERDRAVLLEELASLRQKV